MIVELAHGTSADFAEFYHRHRGRLAMTLDQAALALRGWEVWRLDDPAPVAVILVKDGHGHIAAHGAARVGLSRIRKAMELLGITRTTVGEDFAGGHALAMRLGFTVDHTNGGVTHYVRIPD